MEMTTLSNYAQEDLVLVKKILDFQNEQAYSLLMERHKNNVFQFILRLVNNREDAMDLTLETFGKAFRALHTYTPQYSFSTWILRVASNHTIDFKRKKKLDAYSIDKPFDDESEDSFAASIKSVGNDPAQTYEQKQLIDAIRKAMKKLDEKHRLLLEFRYFDDMPYQDIAELMDIPLGTVKAQLFRAKEILQGYLRNSVVRSAI